MNHATWMYEERVAFTATSPNAFAAPIGLTSDNMTWDWPNDPIELAECAPYEGRNPRFTVEEANQLSMALVGFAVGGALTGAAVVTTTAAAFAVTTVMLVVWLAALAVNFVWG